jgi:hypothetical protein
VRENGSGERRGKMKIKIKIKIRKMIKCRRKFSILLLPCWALPHPLPPISTRHKIQKNLTTEGPSCLITAG